MYLSLEENFTAISTRNRDFAMRLAYALKLDGSFGSTDLMNVAFGQTSQFSVTLFSVPLGMTNELKPMTVTSEKPQIL